MQRLERDTLVDSRYRILNRLGSGGMADVYCAEDQQLGRRVALKILHRRFAEDEQFVERFRREASSAASLSHPNIVGIFDRGEWDSTYYIAMEFVDGRTLKEIIRERGPAPAEAAADVTLQILRAARYAHKHGVVHRDIKPQNVLIDQDGRVRVTDFGIARAGASDMTETGSIMGTAQYLSPEQAQGRSVDERADLYAIGIVLYELLTGRVPFDADSAVSVALKQVSEAPIPPSELVPAIPPAIEAIVLRAMEKAPEHRFQTADEFILALEAARAAPDVIPPPPASGRGGVRGRGARPPLVAVAADPARGARDRDRRLPAAQARAADRARRHRPRVEHGIADPPEPRLRGRHRAGRRRRRRARPRRGAGPAAQHHRAGGLDRHPAGVERTGRGRRPDGRRQHQRRGGGGAPAGGPPVQDRARRTPTRSRAAA